jgi:phage terminase large subunit
MKDIKIRLPYKFKLRDYQRPVWEALKAGKKKVVACWHRGAGKDLFALNFLIRTAIQKPGVYLHCFPKYNQGKKAIWNSVHKTDDGEAMSYLDHIPKELIKSKNSSDMRIEFVNGSIYCVMGIDGKNATQARGMNPCFVVLSEYAYMDPESWFTLEPRVAQNNGTALFLSTPNGQNHFYNLFNHAMQAGGDYFGSRLTIDDTNAIGVEHIEHLRGEGIPEDFIQQEYYCDFTRGAQGSYYGKYIQRARDEDRICRLHINPTLPVHTGWDIGVGDSTAIYFFQELSGGNLNILHYYENHGEGLEHYIRYLDKWKSENNILYGVHFVPHDMKNQEFGSGEQRVDTARNLGYQMTIVPKKSVDEGIQTVRTLLSRCNFDEVKCKRGIECLDLYCKKWNDNLKVYYDEPLHNQFSHGADAFRYIAVGLASIGTSSSRMDKNYAQETGKKYNPHYSSHYGSNNIIW